MLPVYYINFIDNYILNILFILSLLALTIFFTACVSASFMQTGKKYPPLAKDAQVDVIFRAVPSYKVIQIGIVTLKGGLLNDHIKKAKEIARQNGGDVIILTATGSQSRYNANTGSVSTYEVRTFEISKKVLPK